jgi:hypothetical protein
MFADDGSSAAQCPTFGIQLMLEALNTELHVRPCAAEDGRTAPPWAEQKNCLKEDNILSDQIT